MNKLRSFENFRRPSEKVAVGLAAVALLAGCAHGNDRLIISGVPAQIDSKKNESYYDSVVNLWQDDYTVTLEQCDTDIEAAQAGQTVEHPSYDRAQNSIGAGCFAVKYHNLSPRTYDKYQPGTEVTFTGDVGATVKRIG